MALVLALKRRDDFYVRDERYAVKDILSDTHARIEMPDGKIIDVFAEQASEIAPEVFLQVGSRSQGDSVRLAIEAPRDVPILSGKRYREAIAKQYGREP